MIIDSCIFCDFVQGKRKKNTNGFPFVQIHQTRHTTSFLAVDCPPHGKGQILIIPKKHYTHLEDIPVAVRHSIMDHVAFACTVVRKKNPACNVLLNNGQEAGQTVFHVHFHIIPRQEADGIEIEIWDRKQLTTAQFRSLSEQYRRSFLKEIHQE